MPSPCRHDEYTSYVTDPVKALLSQLLTPAEPEAYRSYMQSLGEHLAQAIIPQIQPRDAVNVVCTVEDADFLARGIFETLAARFPRVNLSCFWNKRQKLGSGENALSIAPSFRSYIEPVDRIDTLIVVKSIISGSCVVKTNLADMLDKFLPRQILILAPVMHKDAQRKLCSEFSPAIVNRFQFYAFAIDYQRDSDGTVHPGVGGNVYQRLGFADQEAKNRYTPALVRSRREKVLAS